MAIQDRPNVTVYETVCRIIEPRARLVRTKGDDHLRYWWIDLDTMATNSWPTTQQAWQEAFKLLDRRKGLEDRRRTAI
jgi:hypothetical protein